MEEKEIVWTQESINWLNDIYTYIAQDNPAAALRVITNIYEKVQLLKNFSDLGYIYGTEPEGLIRVLLYGHYRIAYLTNRESKNIKILGVFHSALDIDKYLP
jgi:plasmid stabilization system protein ParE